MAFKDLSEFFDPDLRLPIRGKTYTITSPNAEQGIKIRAMFADDEHVVTNDEELAEIRAMLGPVWDEMQADGVSWIEMMHAGRTALMYYGISPAIGETHWDRGLATPGNQMPPQTGAKTTGRKSPSSKKARTGSTTPAPAPTD